MRAAQLVLVPVSQILLQNLDGGVIIHPDVLSVDYESNHHTHTDKPDGHVTNLGPGTNKLNQTFGFHPADCYEGEPGCLLQNLDGSVIIHDGVTSADWHENDHTWTRKPDGTYTKIGRGTDKLDQILVFKQKTGACIENDPSCDPNALILNLSNDPFFSQKFHDTIGF